MKILLLESSPEIKLEHLTYLKKEHELFTLESELSDEEVDVIIIRTVIVDKKILDRYTNLKYVAKMWVWIDNVDSKECDKRNIKIINTPGANSDSVAELIIWWILYLKRKLFIEYSGVENRHHYMWSCISGSTVWIIWFWNIWKKIYERLLWFWVEKFLIFDPFVKKEEVSEYENIELVKDKKDIFKKSDIISFHIPLLDSTRNFMWQKEIKLLKKDVMVVNTSRWWIINENKLLEFLYDNPNSSYYADVWEEEPNDPKMDFLDLENVLITPHIWAMTNKAEINMHKFNFDK